MSLTAKSLIAPIANPQLEAALRDELARRRAIDGSSGGLEPLAVRLGLIKSSLRPRLEHARLTVFAGDHGLAAGTGSGSEAPTSAIVRALLSKRMPLGVIAHELGLEFLLVDCGIADEIEAHERLLIRRIAPGTRNAHLEPAMSLEQAYAAIRDGMEVGDRPGGDVIACAGLGRRSAQSAALLLSCLTGAEVGTFLDPGASGVTSEPPDESIERFDAVRRRHAKVHDPVELLAGVGGFETAMMAGLILAAASHRRLVVIDGIAACAALRVAADIAPAVVDYCVHARSHRRPGLDRALEALGASALVELGLDSIDGTGAALAWPLIRSASALLG